MPFAFSCQFGCRRQKPNLKFSCLFAQSVCEMKVCSVLCDARDTGCSQYAVRLPQHFDTPMKPQPSALHLFQFLSFTRWVSSVKWSRAPLLPPEPSQNLRPPPINLGSASLLLLQLRDSVNGTSRTVYAPSPSDRLSHRFCVSPLFSHLGAVTWCLGSMCEKSHRSTPTEVLTPSPHMSLEAHAGVVACRPACMYCFMSFGFRLIFLDAGNCTKS